MNTDFLVNHIFWSQLACAIICGGIIGLERQLRGKPIGIRDSTLICLGTTVFMIVGGSVLGSGDPTRVLGQVVTGVGFLGAGLIMNRHGFISGVTSATTVWVLAAVGCAIGLEKFDVAVVVTLITACVLVGIRKLERLFSGLRRGVHDSNSDHANHA